MTVTRKAVSTRLCLFAMQRTFAQLLLCLGLISCLLLVRPPDARSDAEALYGKLKSSALEVLVDGRLSGSGCFVTSYGLALTAAHILKSAKQVEVLTNGFGRLNAVVVATDLGNDLALLRIERLAGLFPHLELSNRVPTIGESVYLFGAPVYRHNLMVTGRLAKPETQFEWNEVNKRYTEVYPVAAMTPEGFSGAPWVDEEGEIVGLQSGMLSWKGSPMGVAFMIPARALSRLVAAVKDVESPSLGAIVADNWEQTFLQAVGRRSPGAGVGVVKTFSNGTLANAGIHKNEVLLGINGVSLDSRDQLLHILKGHNLGAVLQMDVLRESGERVVVPAKLY